MDAARSNPSGRPALGLSLAKTGDRNTISAPAAAPDTASRSPWAETLLIEKCCSFVRSIFGRAQPGQCTPSAPVSRARSGSAAISKACPPASQAARNAAAVRSRPGAPKCRNTTPHPGGRPRTSATGLGVRAGSVNRKSEGRKAGVPAASARRSASRARASRPGAGLAGVWRASYAATMSQSPSDPADIAQRRARILSRIAAAAKEARRDPSDVALVAVSKVQPEARIEAALDAGQRIFGENRVQEAQQRWAERRSAQPDLELRLIGPLQSNKTADAMALFDVIETLDRPKLARAIADAAARTGAAPRLYVQVNTGEEPQKAGITPPDADAFIAAVRDEYGLSVEGLMCIPPADEAAGPHFALLAQIARRNGVEKLSMGMSGDYETAVRLGATSVRVGEAFFGPRIVENA